MSEREREWGEKERDIVRALVEKSIRIIQVHKSNQPGTEEATLC